MRIVIIGVSRIAEYLINYFEHSKHDIVVIDKEPDNPIIEKLLELPYASFNRHYVSDNLNHDIIKLYY